MTNFERIKNMSIDEMATVMADKKIRIPFCEYYSVVGYDESQIYRGCTHRDDFGRYEECPLRCAFGGCNKEGIIEWLKSEADDE